jgi:signal transduction histidine kinase/CheY-like chemotaxis protein
MQLDEITNFLWPISSLLLMAAAIVFLFVHYDANFRRHWKKVAGFCLLFVFVAACCVSFLTLTIQEKTQEKLLGYAPIYARVMERMHHDSMSEGTSEQDQAYLSLVDLEKIWLSANKFVSDIYTMKMNAEGKIYLMVDSETDNDRNGIFDGDREQRTKPGEIDEKDLENLKLAFSGQDVFSGRVVQDRWGSWVSAYVPLRLPDGKIDAVLGVDFDAELYLADQKRMIFLSGLFFEALFGFLLLFAKFRFKEISTNELLVKALKLSEEAKETKSRFISTISHEIRTPLNGISGALELLDLDPTAAETKTYLKIVRSCSSQLLDLVDDVLDFSKLESNKVTLEKIPVDMHQLLSSALDLVRLKAKEKKIELNADFEALRDLSFEGDPVRIRQIVSNLLNNAVKFTSTGSVTLRARNTSKLEISIADTGAGISQESQGKLFQSFSQVDASTTRKFGGTGLGLAISKALVELMGGSIAVESKLGEGSVFSVILPIKYVGRVAFEEIPQTQHIRSGASAEKYKVLIADDNDVNRQLLVRYLAKLGHTCRQAKNGQEALDILENEFQDLVFMDGQMPVMDGYEAVKKIKKQYSKPGKTPKVIAITANANHEDRNRFLNCGADDFLLKPATLSQINEVIAKQMVTETKGRKRSA